MAENIPELITLNHRLKKFREHQQDKYQKKKKSTSSHITFKLQKTRDKFLKQAEGKNKHLHYRRIKEMNYSTFIRSHTSKKRRQ